MRGFMICALALAFCGANATTFKVSDLNAFNEAVKKVQPGDSIVLANQIWKDAELKFKGNGTQEAPIVLTAQTPGKCIIEGVSQLRLSGKYLVVDGLVFMNGHAPKGKVVIDFRTSSEDFAYNSIVRNCVIDHFNYPDKSVQDHWVELWGKNNSVEYCYFAGKMNLGTTLVIWPNGEKHAPNHHHIYRNYFGSRPRLGSNGGETMRIGTSTYSLQNSCSVIEENYFEHCNGETEIISVKSCENKIINNTLFECEGSIVLRHGNNNEVSGNILIGNGKPYTGGIRIINAGHKVFNNYLSGLRGNEFRYPLVIMNGVPNSVLNRYHKVRNAEVVNNTFIDCGTAWHLCLGSDEERTDIPENVSIRANVIYSPQTEKLVNEYDNIKGFNFANNVLIGKNGTEKKYGGTEATYNTVTTREGFTTVIPNLKESSSSYVNTDINGQKRNNEKTVGAFEANSLSARRFIPNQTNCGPRYQWNKVNPSIKTIGKVIKVQPGVNTLYQAIKKSSAGDIIELTSGNYVNEKKMSISHDLTIRANAKATTRPIISVDDKESKTISLFDLKEGASLKLIDVALNGKEKNSRQAKYGIFIGGQNSITHYNLLLDNCEAYNFLQPDGAVILAQKSTFTDTIRIVNSTISNSFRGIALNREKDDKGLYNAEYVILQNSTFRNLKEWAVHFYRGGNDESTLGGFLIVDHCIFDNVNNNPEQYMIKHTGWVNCQITNSLFLNSPQIKGIINLNKRTHFISNCCLIKSGKIKVKGEARANRIYYQMNEISGNASDGKNIGLIN